MTFSYDDVRRLASDPESEWGTLHWIAEEYPELRPAVAANPATYPELLEALADLDDPAITAALMRRFNPEAAPAEGASAAPEPRRTDQPQDVQQSDENPGAEHPEGDAQESGSRAGGAATPEAAPAGPVSGDDADSTTPTPATPEPEETAAAAGAIGTEANPADPAPESPDDGAEGPPPAMRASTLVGGAGAGISAEALQERARRRRSRLGLVLLAVVLPIIALVAIGALVMMLLGDRGEPQAEPDGAAASEPAASESPAETSPSPSAEPSPSPTGPSLQELHAAVAELPQSSSCEDVTDDVDVFTAYAELAAEEGSWSTEDDQLVQQTVEDLQAECGALQSAQVHQQLRDQSAAGLAAAAEDMGTGWIETGYDAPEGAAELTSFMMPSGNIRCEMGDRLRCTIVEHDFAALESCEDADVTTYESTLRTAARPDCQEPVQEADRQILPYGQTTANEYFACQSLRSKLSCWNKITGEGFNLSRSSHSTY